MSARVPGARSELSLGLNQVDRNFKLLMPAFPLTFAGSL